MHRDERSVGLTHTALACILDRDQDERTNRARRDGRRTRLAAEAESASLVNTAYLLYLNLYLLHFQRLSPKEQHALTLVEIEGGSYRDAAARLGIRLENLKMVIFRGRRKIFRGMEISLGRMGAGQGLEAGS